MASFEIRTAAGLALEVNTDDATRDELLTIDMLSPSLLTRAQKNLIRAAAEQRVRLSDEENASADHRARTRYSALRQKYAWRTPQHSGVRYLLALHS